MLSFRTVVVVFLFNVSAILATNQEHCVGEEDCPIAGSALLQRTSKVDSQNLDSESLSGPPSAVVLSAALQEAHDDLKQKLEFDDLNQKLELAKSDKSRAEKDRATAQKSHEKAEKARKEEEDKWNAKIRNVLVGGKNCDELGILKGMCNKVKGPWEDLKKESKKDANAVKKLDEDLKSYEEDIQTLTTAVNAEVDAGMLTTKTYEELVSTLEIRVDELATAIETDQTESEENEPHEISKDVNTTPSAALQQAHDVLKQKIEFDDLKQKLELAKSRKSRAEKDRATAQKNYEETEKVRKKEEKRWGFLVTGCDKLGRLTKRLCNKVKGPWEQLKKESKKEAKTVKKLDEDIKSYEEDVQTLTAAVDAEADAMSTTKTYEELISTLKIRMDELAAEMREHKDSTEGNESLLSVNSSAFGSKTDELMKQLKDLNENATSN